MAKVMWFADNPGLASRSKLRVIRSSLTPVSLSTQTLEQSSQFKKSTTDLSLFKCKNIQVSYSHLNP